VAFLANGGDESNLSDIPGFDQLAGAIMQGVARNPLADPGILRVNAGSTFAVVCAIGLLGITSASGYVWFAFAGALIVIALASLGRSGATPDGRLADRTATEDDRAARAHRDRARVMHGRLLNARDPGHTAESSLRAQPQRR
jgi:hypothetical protein